MLQARKPVLHHVINNVCWLLVHLSLMKLLPLFWSIITHLPQGNEPGVFCFSSTTSSCYICKSQPVCPTHSYVLYGW